MKNSLVTGLAGASSVIVVHEVTRRVRGDAPRMDVLGARAIAGVSRKAGIEADEDSRAVRALSYASGLASDSLGYSLVGASGAQAWPRGLMIGAAVGLGSAFLPGPLGLGSGPARRTKATAAMTVGLYVLGGLVAAATSQLLGRRRQ
jgi:hypothetical protein